MQRRFSLRVNGRERESDADDDLLLVHFLRERLALTGVHIGCLTGHCGACTVIVDGLPVKSCTMFASQAEGADVLTVEGLALNGELHPLQRAFIDNFASQCGYCTPGMLMSAYYLASQNAAPSEAEIRRGIDGNLCRCSCYVQIFEAIKAYFEGTGGGSGE